MRVEKMKIEELLESDNEIIFAAYIGFLTQPLISAMVEILEDLNNEKKLNLSQKMYVVFIELAQNIIHYAQKDDQKAVIIVGKEGEDYYVMSQNLVTEEIKNKLEKIYNEISNLSKDEIKKLYRQRRREGTNSHSKGAGIGFLEIAKIAKHMKFEFTPVKERYIFKCLVFV